MNWKVYLNSYLVLLILFGGCKPSDKEDPSLLVSSPALSFTAQAGTIIEVDWSVSDDKELASLQITLAHFNSGAVVNTQTVTLASVIATGKTNFTLGNVETEGGSYLFRVTAWDAAGNSDFHEVQVQLTEVPEVFDGLLLVGENTLGNDHLFRVENNGQSEDFGKIGEDVSGFVASRTAQKIFYTTRITARLQGRDYADPSQILFDQSVPNGAQESAFTGLLLIGQQLVTSLGIPPFGRIYDLNGNSLKTINQLEYPAPALSTTEDPLKKEAFFAQVQFPGSIKRIDRFHYDANIQVNGSNLTWDPNLLVPTSGNRVIAAGEEAGAGKIATFNEGLSLTQTYNIVAPVRAMAYGEGVNKIFIAAGDGIHIIHSSGSAPGTPIKAGAYYSLFFDPIDELFYAGGDGFVDKIDPDGIVLQQFLGTWGKVKFIQGKYTR